MLKPLSAARFSDLFAATTIGFSGVFLVGRAGEFVRPVVLSMRDPRVRPSASLVTIIVERIYDLTAVALMFAVNLIWFSRRPQPKFRLTRCDRRRRTARRHHPRHRFSHVVQETIRRRDRLFRTALRALALCATQLSKACPPDSRTTRQALRVLVNFRELAKPSVGLFWSGLAIAAANLLVMRAFHLPIGLSETIFVLGLVAGRFTRANAGGAAGAFHAATAAGSDISRRKKETAAALSIVLHLVDFGPAVLFGLFYVIRGDLSLAKLRAMISPAGENPVGDRQDAQVSEPRKGFN